MIYRVAFILLSTTLIFINAVASQSSFPDENDHQKWEYVRWNFWGGKCQLRSIKTGGQVEKCNNKYIEIFDCDEYDNNCQLIGYYRIQHDSILIRTNHPYLHGVMDTVVCDEGEGLMYDFGAMDMDTMVCQLNSTWPASFINVWQTDERYIEYEGVDRKTKTMSYQPYSNSRDIVFRMRWIEGIGSDVHPFYSLSCIGDHCEQELQLVRAERNDELIYLDTVLRFSFPCNGWVTSTENYQNIDLSINPNPTTGLFWLSSQKLAGKKVDLIIYNSEGKQMRRYNHQRIGEPVDISTLAPGVYFLETLHQEVRSRVRMVKI